MKRPDDESDADEDVDDVVSMYERDDKVGPGDVSGPDPEEESDDDSPESDDDSPEPALQPPKVEPVGGELDEVTGTFYVKYAQEMAVTLHDVDTAQICTLIENPGFERHDIVEGTLAAQPPMGVSYLVEELDAHYSVPVEASPEAPTKQVRDIATTDLAVGDAMAIEREGKGEIHILRVEPDQTAQTVEDLLDDEMTYKNAARYSDVERVEIRTDEDLGVVSIRYLP